MIGSFRQALQEPLLEAEEERDAILRWQRDQDSAAIELLVRSHVRQVWSQARRWTDNPVHLEDLVAEGVIGLMRAAESFDTARGVRFSTYAAWWIRNEVSAAMKRERGPRASGWDSERRQSPAAISPDAFREAAFDSLVELEEMPSEDASPEEDVLRRSNEEAITRRLKKAMDGLSSLEAEVIRRRRLATDPEPFDAIARDLKATPARIRQIETRALARLRQSLLAQGFSLSVLH